MSFYSDSFLKNQSAHITFKLKNDPGEHLYFGVTSSKHRDKGLNMPASGNVILFDGGNQESGIESKKAVSFKGLYPCQIKKRNLVINMKALIASNQLVISDENQEFLVENLHKFEDFEEWCFYFAVSNQ